jgi:UDP-glucose 4-epimerase
MTEKTENADFIGARCLVTGGAGFIGSHLVRRLLAADARVTVIEDFSVGRRENLPTDANLTVIEGDLTAFPDLERLTQSADFVFHLAAQVGNIKSLDAPERDAETNVLATVRLLRACRGTRVRRLVYASSSAIFGEAESIPIVEDHRQSPESFYALSKLTAEKYTLLAWRHWRVPGVCLRYFNVFGLPMEDNEYTGVISIFFRRLAAGLPLRIFGDGSQVRDFVYVDDVARANMLAAMFSQSGRTYNIGTGKAISIRELAEIMQRTTGRVTEIIHEAFRLGEVRRSVADISRARAELGFEPSWDLARGVAAMWRTLAAEPAGLADRSRALTPS